ncbi:MAG TPA: TipAS antibiotic-recognition domain-containing protein, partial [Deinococcales bacterium]|nr:TipAS antibiotic-recognition domain-containing protein [Deinococcales bacterium]
YTKADWDRFKAESEDWGRRIAALVRAGASPESLEAMALAEEHRASIDRWFYPCSYEMQVGLAEMYVADERFTATYEQIQPGLTRFLHDAITANATRRQ